MAATIDLVTPEEAQAFLDKEQPNDVVKVGALITYASAWLERMTDRPLASRAFTNLRLTGGEDERLYVPAWPISASATVTLTVNGTAQTVWRAESDGDLDDFDVWVGSDDPFDERTGLRNHLYRESGWLVPSDWTEVGFSGSASGLFRERPVPSQPMRLLLSYTGGYTTIPQDLKLACLYLVQKLWKDQAKQQTGLQSLTTPTGGTLVLPPDPSMPPEVKILAKPYARHGVLVGIL